MCTEMDEEEHGAEGLWMALYDSSLRFYKGRVFDIEHLWILPKVTGYGLLSTMFYLRSYP